MANSIFSISNQKGGVGKSTTTLAMAAGLARQGRRVLVIDMDAQGNTTTTAGGEGAPDVFDVLTGTASAAEAVHETTFGASIIPAGRRLVQAEAALIEMGKEYRLREALQPIRANFDFVIIDTPPALGILTINALTAADGVIIPATAEPYSIQGIAHLKLTIDAVKKYSNPNLRLLGLLLTRYRATKLMANMGTLAAKVAAELDAPIYTARIRESTGVKEAQAARRPLQGYKPAKSAADDYEAFITEVLEQVGR